MVYLVWDGRACGLAALPEVRAPYETLQDALAQALHDLTMGRTPLRIIDGQTGALLWQPEEGQP